MTEVQANIPRQPARHPNTSRSQSTRLARLTLAVTLFSLLYNIYLLTYSGVINSDDERYILDTMESIVERGDMFLNETTYIEPYRTSGVEPAQPFLATPFYFIADRLPFLGKVQTIFLFNPVVTALTAVVLFYFTLDLGYRKGVALLAGLTFGIGTVAWPYTKTFFREPLASLLLVTCLFFIHRWRMSVQTSDGKQKAFWLALAAIAFLLSAFTKESALVAAPVVVAYALPPIMSLRANRRVLFILGGGVAGAAVLLVGGIILLQSVSAIAGRYDIGFRLLGLLQERVKPGPGIAGFLVSPGKSVFVFSPVALLAVAGLFFRQSEHRREQWLATGMLLTFVVIYALIQGVLWYGGSGWGPRYLVPVTPVLILGGLPLVKRGLESPRLWPRVGLALLALASVAIQVPGLLVNMHDYYRDIGPLGNGAAWTIAVWQVKYTQVLGHLRLLPHRSLDLAWIRPSTDWLILGVLAGGVVTLVGVLLWQVMRPLTHRWAVATSLGNLVFVAGLSAFGLHRAYYDPYFDGDVPALHELVDFLKEGVSPTDAIVLSNPAFVDFFANYYKGDAVWFTMPRSPGERHSEEEVPHVVSDNPDDLVSQRALDVLWFATYSSGSPQHSVWLVVDGGPFTPWNPRPPEWWAAERYYTVWTHDYSPTVRLVQYLNYLGPDPDAPPAHERRYHLGQDIVLAGYDLQGLNRPEPRAFHPGDSIGVSLTWRADGVPGDDYIAAVFVIGPDGQVYLQQDRTPVASFRPTSSWKRGETLRDNYGFILPPDAPLGRYELWVAMYSWPSLERLPATSPTGDRLGDVIVLTSFQVLDDDEPSD